MRTLCCLTFVALGLLPSALRAQVPYARLAETDSGTSDWLTYSGNYASHRYSSLDQITKQNASRLRTTWVYQVRRPGLVETSPLVVDDVMVVTEPPSTVTALDVRSGRVLWSWSPSLPRGVRHIGFPPVNRGVAVLDESLYVGTLDAHLVALDMKSGAVRWDVVVADNKTGHAITAAPLAVDGKIIVGISGGEAGIRGFLDAYDAKTGERLWRFWTIPGPGEPGHDTWGGDSWKTGAGPTWVTGSYDPQLKLLYWGTGNPGPDWNGDLRPGDNLYTCSLVALDVSTGKLKWHYQFTPHDLHDWDACQIPVLVDAEINGKPRQLVVVANRNAFYYVLDRQSGELLHATAYAKQTWAQRIDENGRPVLIPGTEPSEKGTLVYPSLQGATNWFSPSFSPRTQMLYVAVRQMGAHYFKTDADYEPGQPFLGGGEQALAGDQASGVIRALAITTGEKQWDFDLHSPPWSGVLSTAGGLVIGGTNEGNVFALDDQTGKPLWQFQTGGAVRANPIAFAIDGHQQIAIAAGNAIFVFGLPAEESP
jgi:alcohol dehydrogenase (cytochrome c)